MAGLQSSTLGTTSHHERKQTTAIPLPIEIRLKIYAYLLKSRRVLRKKAELRTVKCLLFTPSTELPDSESILHDTAILGTSRTTYTEAVQIFYNENCFHHSIPSAGAPSSAPFHLHLPMMRHIRVEYNLNTDLGPRHTEPRHTNSQIDRAISLQLKAIAAHSPLIRTFGLKLISGPINGGDRLKDALTGVTLTGPALGDLAAKVHDHLSISSIANKFWADEEGTEAFHDIRLAVAADDCWETQGFLLPETLPREVTEISGEVWLCNIGELRRRG